jgi:peptidoglycan hydrolase-like protein with peptidoglycan-binding domain
MPFTASVISAKDWGARPPKEWPAQTIPRYIVIHHTATFNPPRDFSRGTVEGGKAFARSIQRTHMVEFGWNDSGHNFLNTTAGILLEGRQGSLDAVKRGRCVRSAHAGSDTGNESPGIENEGDFTTYQMNTQQWNSLVELCASICSSCKIDPDNIRGHRDFSPTSCPGNWLYGQLPRLRQEVKKRLGSAPDYLREGASGEEVKELQQRLKDKGFNPGPIDGIFGPSTLQAVISFQKYNDLDPDGIVGPLTWEALRKSTPTQNDTPVITLDLLNTYLFYRGLPHQNYAVKWLQGQLTQPILDEFAQRWRDNPSDSFPPIQEGETGTKIEQLQRVLQQNGYNPGPIDGVFGPMTKVAVIAFQKAKNLEPNGIVDEQTWTILNRA